MPQRTWTVYIAQDKHLDYDWCGAETEIEPRMAALVDGYLDLAETGRARWNLDCALWLEVYRRQRGEAGAARLLGAIRRGLIGYGAQHSVMLWGLMGPDLAARALAAGREIEAATGRPAHTALIMENAGLSWGVAQALADAGVRYVARGIYDLRAESYAAQRAPYPLYWWAAPDGSRLLTHWPLYDSTRTWGGYAEASELLRLAGEDWDAFHLRRVAACDDPEVYAARVAYIQATVARYEALGDGYPVSQIMLLGTGWDNWVITDDVSRFIERFNAQEEGRIRLVDARYDEFFAAVEREIAARGLTLPEQRGSYGACWEEWGAHLAATHAEFRRAERLLPRIEAGLALASDRDPKTSAAEDAAMDAAYGALLRYAEHDMGGCNLATAAIAAGNRAAATTRALTIARTLGDLVPQPPLHAMERGGEEDLTPWSSLQTAERGGVVELAWRGGRAALDPLRCAIVSLRDGEGVEWAPAGAPSGASAGLGELIRTRYAGQGPFREVLPEPLPSDPQPSVVAVLQREGPDGVEIELRGRRWGLDYAATWQFDGRRDEITLAYRLCGAWGAAPQTLAVAFPLALGEVSGAEARYHYDSIGAITAAGRPEAGGDELPGANPVLRALHTFAAAHTAARGAVLLSPGAHLVAFGPAAQRAVGPLAAGQMAAAIVSLPMMNLTRNDHQVAQGGRSEWFFRYRLILERGPFDALSALRAAQRFAPPFLWMPGVEPIAPGLSALEIAYEGGPLLSCRRAMPDGLLLRFWNATDRPAEATLRLPAPYRRAERCDALGRPLGPLPLGEGARARLLVGARGCASVALRF